MEVLHYFGIILFVYSCNAFKPSNTPGAPQSVGQPWPLPQSFKSGSTVYQIDPERFRFASVGYSCDIYEDALQRYFKIIFDSTYSRTTTRRNINADDSLPYIKVKLLNECERYPSLQMDESCELKR